MQSGGGTAPAAPRSRGGDFLSPHLAPGRRQQGEGDAHTAPRNQSSASKGLQDGWGVVLARHFARVKRSWDVGKKGMKRDGFFFTTWQDLRPFEFVT